MKRASAAALSIAPVTLALVSYLLFLPGIIKFFTVLGLVLGASLYAFKVAALASRGVLHSRDTPTP